MRVTDLTASSTIQTLSLPITQPICTFALDPGGQVFAFTGGSCSITVTAGADCKWSVSGAPTWVTIISGATGSGNGSVNYVVSANDTNGSLNATPIIAGLPFNTEEQTASPLPFVGSMPHIAAQENWTTTFTLVNKGTLSATARLSLYGDPGGILMLPLAFPQQPMASIPLRAASLDRTLNGNASLITEMAGRQTPPVEVGSAQLAATGAIDGFAIFHLSPSAQEAVVPVKGGVKLDHWGGEKVDHFIGGERPWFEGFTGGGWEGRPAARLAGRA